MANDSDDLDKNIENLKTTVRKHFACVYAALKATELKTLRQLDAIRKQCQDDKDLKRNCVQNIHISYDNESTLLDNISNYGIIDFEKLNFDSNTFLLEDYISPNDDHMYCYKTIEELTKEEDDKRIEAIEEAALKQITRTENCVCYVNIRTDEISKKFRNLDLSNAEPPCNDNLIVCEDKDTVDDQNVTDDEKSDSSDGENKKIDPTDDWLKSIKSQTETEPSQVNDVMEHSTIVCS